MSDGQWTRREGLTSTPPQPALNTDEAAQRSDSLIEILSAPMKSGRTHLESLIRNGSSRKEVDQAISSLVTENAASDRWKNLRQLSSRELGECIGARIHNLRKSTEAVTR